MGPVFPGAPHGAAITQSTSATPITFVSGELTLEGQLSLPEGRGPFAGVLLCHPHPLYGGDMQSPVVRAMTQALLRHGIAALAFNFRGVGASQGAYSRGAGEVQDALAAFDHLGRSRSLDAQRLGIAGYSFGAAIALEMVLANQEAQAIALVACPASSLNDLELHQIARPKLFIQGDIDHGTQIDLFRFLVQRFHPPRQTEVLQGADHYLLGNEPQVGQLVAEFFQRHLA